jgi:preprotein translocase subunit YajC
MSSAELALERVRQIEEALKAGKKVVIRGVVVKKVEVVNTARSIVIKVNDGELNLYSSEIVRARLNILDQ